MHVEVEHPEVAQHWRAVRAVIEAPDLITHDVTHESGENVYRMAWSPGFPGEYLKVCIGYGAANVLETIARGELVTAYPRCRVKEAEEHLWP